MCQPARCRSCGKTTWSGCGLHVDQVMANVSEADRCTCSDEPKAPQESDDAAGGSLLRRLRGR